ncbi:tetratricopeptide repeat protein [Litoreibacter roseus]|uniref:Tetratricopeptide repeat protein n=1 Tax=Litoreibacter roseus TaxID=2601869 RepID=A0A6N6JK03_9RHOB|nr:tetratricopeptide repeat protein [Litoreibacter roseus]GFE66375.1 hypothetical protein KIN_34490 [Litoreibacter roseus]
MTASSKFRDLVFTAALAGLLAPGMAPAQGVSGPYLAARQATIASDYDDAAKYYRKAIDRDQGNLTLLENALISMIALGDIEGAVEVARRHLKAGGENQIVAITLNTLAIRDGKFDAEMVPSSDPQGLTPLVDGLINAWIEIGRGQMSQALAAFDAVAETPDFASFARYQQSLALAMVGDFEAADDILSGAKYGPLTLSTRGMEAHAQVLVQLDRSDDALALVNAATEQSFSAELNDLRDRLNAGEEIEYDFVTTPQHGAAEVYYNMAAILNGRAAPEHIMIYSRMAELLREDHVPALLTIAETLDDIGQYDLATKAFARVPNTHPAYFIAEMGRADSLYSAERKDASIEVLTALSKAYPDTAVVHSALADLLSREERDEAALAAYTRSLELHEANDRDAWPVHYARGIVHERMGNLAEMEADFRTALEMSPDQPDVLNYLGYSLVEQRIKLPEALEMIKTAVERRPDSGYITDSLAWVYFRLGRYEDAVEPMERAVELLPVDPIVNDHLGDVYWKVNRFREAEFQWKRALSFEPEEADAERIRRKIEVGLDKVLAEEEAEAGETQTAND